MMKIEYVHPKTLIPHPKNRNIHPENQIEKLEKLIKTFGFKVPILISKNSGYIVSGHARHLVALRLNLETVPIIFLEFDSEEKEYAFLVNDNLIHEFSFLDRAAISIDITSNQFDPELFCDIFENEKIFLGEDINLIEKDDIEDEAVEYIGQNEKIRYVIHFYFNRNEDRLKFFTRFFKNVFKEHDPERRQWIYQLKYDEQNDKFSEVRSFEKSTQR